jgi:capsular exopolysaccharide synthesis family protein
MSRIDEAMRRASAQNSEAAAIVASEDARMDALGLSHSVNPESFPGEPATAAHARQPSAPLLPTPSEAEADDGGLTDRLSQHLAEKVIVDGNTPQGSTEQYRSLAATLLDAQAESGTRVVMVASAVPSEGKTLTACNLALTLSESYQKRVLLIDGDLRRPTLHEMFRLNAASGLSESLRSPTETKLLLRQVSSKLAILPAGRPSSDPMASLTSDRMRRLLDEARETFDWVIIDTPPLVLLPDANLLAPMADGVVLVIRAASTPHAMVARAIEAIGKNRTLGIVLNRVETDDVSYGGYYYGYGSADPKAR